MPDILRFPGLIRPFIFMMVFTAFLAGCTKDDNPDIVNPDPFAAAGIKEVIPANLADSVEVNPVVSVTFKEGTDQSKLSSSALSLKKGNEPVPGRTIISGTTAIFTPETDLVPETEYTATIKTGHKGSSEGSEASEYSWKFRTGKHHHKGTLSVVSTDPANNATAVSVAAALVVTFNQELTSLMKNSTLISLKAGLSPVQGTMSFSGNTATFKPTENLAPATVYSGRVKMGSGSHDDDKSGDSYFWSFTTGAEGTDVSAPVVSSVFPANNAISVATGINCTVLFSEPMNSAMITTSTIILKQGTTTVPGTVTYSGVTATFTPSSQLAANTLYTGTVTTGVRDVAGNAMASNYTWSFTTAADADVIAPTVISVTPLANATAVATNIKPSVTFSEAMKGSSITSSTFTLKQGVTAIAGTVSYSGTTATFTPSSPLAGNTTYAGTITTGATDAAGNPLAADYTWSFTTVTVPVLLSFASDVVPVLNLCNDCHKHGWTTSTVASTFYTNLVNAGYVDASSPTTSKIYTKLNSGHPGSSISTADINKILNWMTQGSNNN